MATGLRQNFEYRVLLEAIKRVGADLLGRDSGHLFPRYFVRQIARSDFLGRAVDNGSRHDVAKLAHIAWPRMAPQYIDGFGREAAARIVLL